MVKINEIEMVKNELQYLQYNSPLKDYNKINK